MSDVSYGRFREHPSFIFSAFNILQRREVGEWTTMKVSRASFESKARIYAKLQVGAIQRVSEHVEMGQYDFREQDEKDVCELMRDVHTINSTVDRSAAAQLKMRNEIRTMITSLGAPSFFITVNPADVFNPMVNLLAGNDININQLLPEQVPDYHRQSILIAKDPVLAAQFFHLYMKAFFTAVLGYNPDNVDDISPGLLGITKGYYGVVEAQG
ncbi:hypothetical protein F5887DRAFT_928700 [Amanita rubescens]|nr:hypothetical protein F5887DRAFT_928700 [Amanita rubescens]